MFGGFQASPKTFAKLLTRHKHVLEAPLSAGGAPRSGQDQLPRQEKRAKIPKLLRGLGEGRQDPGQAKPILVSYKETPPPPL